MGALLAYVSGSSEPGASAPERMSGCGFGLQYGDEMSTGFVGITADTSVNPARVSQA